MKSSPHSHSNMKPSPTSKIRLSTFSETDWELFRKQIRTIVWGGIVSTVSLGKTPEESAEERSTDIISHIRKYL